jgi:hypothetical protein
MAGVDAMSDVPDYVRRHAENLADQLLADLKSGVLEKIGLDEIERYVAASYIAIVGPRPGLRLLTDWTVRYVVEKAAKQ